MFSRKTTPYELISRVFSESVYKTALDRLDNIHVNETLLKSALKSPESFVKKLL